MHISKICCTFAPDFKKEFTKHQKETQKVTKMKTKNLQEKTIQRIIATMFWSEKKARKAVAEFWELAERGGCRTPKDFAEEITNFICF